MAADSCPKSQKPPKVDLEFHIREGPGNGFCHISLRSTLRIARHGLKSTTSRSGPLESMSMRNSSIR